MFALFYFFFSFLQLIFSILNFKWKDLYSWSLEETRDTGENIFLGWGWVELGVLRTVRICWNALWEYLTLNNKKILPRKLEMKESSSQMVVKRITDVSNGQIYFWPQWVRHRIWVFWTDCVRDHEPPQNCSWE